MVHLKLGYPLATFVTMLATFLSLFSITVARSAEGNESALADPKIVILGATGVGKSSLANVFIGVSPECENCTFPICPGGDSCTNDTSYAVGNWLGEGEIFTVVDTPGFGESDDDQSELIHEMVDVLKDEVNTTNSFLLVFKGNDERFNDKIQQMVRTLETLFGYMFWNNVVLCASFWPYDEQSIKQRNHTGKTEEWWAAETNSQLQKRFHLDHDLPAVFIDSYAKMPWNVDDPPQKEAFERETSKLWNITTDYDSFAFKTLQDVLEDYYECMRTVEEDIAEIKEELLVVHQNFTNVDEKFNGVENEIKGNKYSSDHADQDLRDNIADVTLEIQAISEQMDTNKEDIEEKLECAISDSWKNDTYFRVLLEGEISEETSYRTLADERIQSDIDTIDGRVDTLETDINSDIESLKKNVTENEKAINTIKSQINDLENRTRFSATKTGPNDKGDVPKGIIKFQHEDFDFLNNFDHTEGVFTASTAGIYQFFFCGYTHNNQDARLRVYKLDDGKDEDKDENWEKDHYFGGNKGSDHTFWWTYDLNKGDRIKLYNDYGGSFVVDENLSLHFMGYLAS